MHDVQDRQLALNRWLSQNLATPYKIDTIKSGAGTRRYFRVITQDKNLVVMDGYQDKKLKNFIELSAAFKKLSVETPEVLQAEMELGFLLLTDFGNQSFSDALNLANVNNLYATAMETLLKIQKYPATALFPLQNFDTKTFRLKMDWFLEYYLQQMLKLNINMPLQNEMRRLFDYLIASLMDQPITCVHYDYHCKNLMLLADNKPGVLDFQDAVWGPITFDLMSLVRDCYVDWPNSMVLAWIQQFHRAVLQSATVCTEDPTLWQKWCDYSSAVRHIKCIGQFAHFHITGYSSEYLMYIPRVVRYLKEVAVVYPEMASLAKLLEAIRP
ncbi:MAG: phosphotransferase [Proteobacteria bacterium]|nr:phosphotransferase [Pseudomonadota bacterium]